MLKIYNGYGLQGVNKFVKGGVFDEATWRKLCRQMANAGCDTWRHLPYSVWGISDVLDGFFPYLIADGKFDLAAWNENWFAIMRRAFAIQLEYNITPVLELFENCQLNGPEKKYSPWVNNVQGIKSFYEVQANYYTKAWVEKCIIEFPGVKFGQCNEGADEIVRLAKDIINPTLKAHGLIPFCYGATFKPYFPFELDAPGRAIVKRFGLKGKDLMDDAEKVRDNAAWYNSLTSAERLIIAKIAAASTAGALHELKKDAGYLWTAASGIEDKIFRVAHKCVNNKNEQVILMARYYSNKEKNYGLSDDGVTNGAAADKRPNDAEWAGMIEFAIAAKEGGELWFEHTPEDNDLARNVATIKAMSAAIYKMTEIWPVNYGKFPEPVVPDPIEPDPIEPTVKVTWQFWAGLGALAIAIVVLLILIF